MNDGQLTNQSPKEELWREVLDLRMRLSEAKDTLLAIRSGEIDALMVPGPQGEHAFTLDGAHEPYRLMVESMAEGAVTCSLDGNILYCNAGFADLVNRALEQVFGSSILNYIPASYQDTFKSSIQKKLPVVDRSQMAIKSGTNGNTPVLCSTRPLTMGERQVIVAVFTDISKVIAAKELEARLSMLVESSADAIISTTLDGTVVSWNKSAKALFNYTKDEAIGQTIQTLITPNSRIKDFTEKLARARRGIASRHLDTVYKQKDGRLVNVDSMASPMFDINGKPVGLSIILRDISELKEKEEKLQELNANLEQRVLERTAQLDAANKELESFSYSVSHDLRAPLRSLSGFSSIVLAEHGQNLDDDGKDCLRRIEAAAKKMAILIDEILRLSRISRTQVKYEICDLSAMAEDTIAELPEQAGARSVDIQIQKNLSCQGDRQLLAIVLQNLLSNAWKFSGRTKNAKIEFGSLIQDGGPVFFVRDNGAGFDMTYADKLFGVFQRLHSTSEFEGVGIGLSIVKRIIDRHNGRVWAEGAVDKGATFYFTIGKPAPE
ncbi:MAG: PAS domain S-box protein [Candidatus Obscuribacterales bacterium]